eukprot:3562423-Heterocapsa_arctica.AAC.1
MCGDFKRGNCDRGDRCKYSHDAPGGEEAWPKEDSWKKEEPWPKKEEAWPKKEDSWNKDEWKSSASSWSGDHTMMFLDAQQLYSHVLITLNRVCVDQ